MLDEDWFAAFYRRRYPAILAYGARRVGPEAARDLAAEVFLVVWRRSIQLTEAEELPWLYTAALSSQMLPVQWILPPTPCRSPRAQRPDFSRPSPPAP